MAPGKISCELTGSPSLNKVFELNQIESYYGIQKWSTLTNDVIDILQMF